MAVGRNHPCPCGSGRKFKLCCGAAGSRKAAANAGSPLATIVPEPAPLTNDGSSNRSGLAVEPSIGNERIPKVPDQSWQIQFGPLANMFV